MAETMTDGDTKNSVTTLFATNTEQTGEIDTTHLPQSVQRLVEDIESIPLEEILNEEEPRGKPLSELLIEERKMD